MYFDVRSRSSLQCAAAIELGKNAGEVLRRQLLWFAFDRARVLEALDRLSGLHLDQELHQAVAESLLQPRRAVGHRDQLSSRNHVLVVALFRPPASLLEEHIEGGLLRLVEGLGEFLVVLPPVEDLAATDAGCLRRRRDQAHLGVVDEERGLALGGLARTAAARSSVRAGQVLGAGLGHQDGLPIVNEMNATRSSSATTAMAPTSAPRMPPAR